MSLWFCCFSALAGQTPLYGAIREVEKRYDIPVFVETHDKVGVQPQLIDSPIPAASAVEELEAAVSAFNQVSDCDQYRVESTPLWTAVRLTRWRVGADCVDYSSRFEQPLTTPGNISMGHQQHDWGDQITFAGEDLDMLLSWDVVDSENGIQPTPRQVIERVMEAHPGHVWKIVASTEGALTIIFWHRATRKERRADVAVSTEPYRDPLHVGLAKFDEFLLHRDPPPGVVAELRVRLNQPGRDYREPISAREQALINIMATAPLRPVQPIYPE